MTIHCPTCGHELGFKERKPGRFTPRCPSCQRRFSLTFPDDPHAPPLVRNVPTEPVVHPQTLPGPTAPVEATIDGVSSTDRISRDSPIVISRNVSSEGAPATIGSYRISRLLGRGGMGAVYLARQLWLKRLVALKVMRLDWAYNALFVSRLSREAYAARQIRHQNLIRVQEIGEGRGTYYFCTEFVAGRSVGKIVDEQKRIDPTLAAVYVLQAARGLRYAHSQGMIHRDIKPDHLLLSDEGLVKLADLGLTKTPAFAEVEAAVDLGLTTVTRPSAKRPAAEGGPIALVNAAVGTPAYMAPEQARDAISADARADLYSLGCTYYALITGRAPFEGSTAVELLGKHQSEPVIPPDTIVKGIPQAHSEIILRLLAKRPDDRYATVGELIAALEDSLGIARSGVFIPSEEDAKPVAGAADAFHSAPSTRLRTKLLLGASAGWAAFFLLAVILRLNAIRGWIAWAWCHDRFRLFRRQWAKAIVLFV